jgi:hypothetical protein
MNHRINQPQVFESTVERKQRGYPRASANNSGVSSAIYRPRR